MCDVDTSHKGLLFARMCDVNTSHKVLKEGLFFKLPVLHGWLETALHVLDLLSLRNELTVLRDHIAEELDARRNVPVSSHALNDLVA